METRRDAMSQILKKAELLLSKGFLKLIRTVDNEEMVVTSTANNK